MAVNDLVYGCVLVDADGQMIGEPSRLRYVPPPPPSPDVREQIRSLAREARFQRRSVLFARTYGERVEAINEKNDLVMRMRALWRARRVA